MKLYRLLRFIRGNTKFYFFSKVGNKRKFIRRYDKINSHWYSVSLFTISNKNKYPYNLIGREGTYQFMGNNGKLFTAKAIL